MPFPTEFNELLSEGWLWAYLGVFAAGVGTSLTPCVYPMIPIVVGIFGAKDAPRGRAFFLASLYVLGMGLMFAGLGIAAALAGKLSPSGLLANPWIVVPMVVFYAVLAAAMFGMFELQLPASLQARLSTVGGRGAGGAFAMGLVGGLTAAPCTGPILLGILAFVATTKNVALGSTLLFTYALGIGVLFFALAVFAASLPKSGPWMEGVKTVGGVALLVVGLYFLRPILPALMRPPFASASTIFLLGAIGLAVLGVAFGAVHLSFHGGRLEKARKGAGVALLVAGLFGIVGWVVTPKRPLEWRKDEQAALAEARDGGRPMLVDFGATWCAPCLEYEARKECNPAVHREITSRFVPLKFDVTKMTPEDEEVQRRWKAGSLPTVILVDSEGNEHARFGEPIPSADEFLRALTEVP